MSNATYTQYTILKPLYDISVGFKVLDVVVDSTRLIHEPTADNARNAEINSAHLYSMLKGFNWYSATVNAAEVIYLGYMYEYSKVLQHAIVVTTYIGLHRAVAYLVAPQIAFIYSAFVTGYSAYSALVNLYSLYEEYMQNDWSLKSDAAYAELGWLLRSSLDQSSPYQFTESGDNTCQIDYMIFQ